MTLLEKQQAIISGNLYKAIWALSFPIIINSLIQTMYNLVDGLWMARVGSAQMAAVSLVWPINALFIAIGMGLSVAATSLIAQHIGAGRHHEANNYASQIIAMAVVAGIVFGGIGFALTPQILRLMGAEQELLQLATTYLRLVFLDTPFTFFFLVYSAIMNAQGNTVAPTVLSGISAVINIVLDPIFIFGLNMGISGAAVATVLSKICMALAAGYLLYRGHSKVNPSFRGFCFDKTIVRHSLRVAVPSAVGQSGSSLGFIVLNSFIVSYGTATMAAFGMTNRVFELATTPFTSMGIALVSIVGQNVGAKNISRVRESINKVNKLNLLVGSAVAILLFIFRVPLIQFFMPVKDSTEAVRQGVEFLKIFSWSAPFMGIFFAFTGLFQGTGHTKYCMVLEVARLWCLRLPLILIFKSMTGLGSEGIWYAMCISNFASCALAFTMYKLGTWSRDLKT